VDANNEVVFFIAFQKMLEYRVQFIFIEGLLFCVKALMLPFYLICMNTIVLSLLCLTSRFFSTVVTWSDMNSVVFHAFLPCYRAMGKWLIE
jgi:hypothetical protein